MCSETVEHQSQNLEERAGNATFVKKGEKTWHGILIHIDAVKGEGNDAFDMQLYVCTLVVVPACQTDVVIER